MIEQKDGLPTAEDEEEAGDGWDMGEDIALDTAAADSDFVNVDNPDALPEAAGPGSSEADCGLVTLLWRLTMLLPALSTRYAIAESSSRCCPVRSSKPRFLEIYQASKTFLPAAASLPPLINYNRRTIDETDTRKLLPRIPQKSRNDQHCRYARGLHSHAD